ncbi:unnamed protein product [Phytomonas sp. Hart1]|nr:unnamed protein product [Phytomonas sp. Hart1]|eukprot:CCW68510.1 unnamed protein product [Phytomonas sp. isolate Hart1]
MIAKEAEVALVEVEEWLTDQCYRSPTIDRAVVKLFSIHYEYVAEIDEGRQPTRGKHRRSRGDRDKEKDRDPIDDNLDRSRRRRS